MNKQELYKELKDAMFTKDKSPSGEFVWSNDDNVTVVELPNGKFGVTDFDSESILDKGTPLDAYKALVSMGVLVESNNEIKMKYIHTFESFLNEGRNTSDEKKLLNAGKTVIRAQYLTKTGEFVLVTPTSNISFVCTGGADISIADGDIKKIKNTAIVDAKIETYVVTLKFTNGETIVLEDETGGEGIEIDY